VKDFEINKCGDNSPNKVKHHVVPEVALKCATNNERYCTREVKDVEHASLKRNNMEHDKSIGSKDCNGSIPLYEISEYF
jgi:hypothetical protein